MLKDGINAHDVQPDVFFFSRPSSRLSHLFQRVCVCVCVVGGWDCVVCLFLLPLAIPPQFPQCERSLTPRRCCCGFCLSFSDVSLSVCVCAGRL